MAKHADADAKLKTSGRGRFKPARLTSSTPAGLPPKRTNANNQFR